MKGIRHISLGSQKTGRDQYQVRRYRPLRPLHRLHTFSPRFRVFLRFQTDNFQLADPALLVLHKLFDCSLIDTRVMAVDSDGFLLPVIRLAHLGPLGPGIILGSLVRRLRHHFQLRHRLRAQADGSTYAVVSGVSAADHHHMSVLSVDILSVSQAGIQKAFRHRGQKINRKIDALRLSSRCLDISGIRRPAAQNHPVKFVQQFFGFFISSHIYAGDKGHSLRLHKGNPPVYDLLLQFHIRDTVAQQTSHPVMTFKHCHLVTSAV